MASTIAGSALQVLYTFAAARLLDPTSYGELVALLSVIGILSAPSGTVQMVVTRFSAAATAQGTLQAFRGTFRTLIRQLTLATAILVVAGVLIAEPLAEYLHLQHVAPLYSMTPIYGGVLLIPLLRGCIQGFCRFGTLAALSAMDIAFKVLLGLALIAAGFGSAGAMVAIAAGAVASLAVSAWSLRSFLALASDTPGQSTLREMASFTVPVFGVSGGLTAMAMLDTILARHYFDPDVAGGYAAVAVVGRSLFWISGAVATAVLPLAARRRDTGPGSLLWPALAITGGVALFGLLVFHLVPGLVMQTLFGARYLGTARLLPAYGWAALLLALGNVTVNYLLGQGRGRAAIPVLAAVVAFLALALVHHAEPFELIFDLIAAGAVFLAALSLAIRGSHNRQPRQAPAPAT